MPAKKAKKGPKPRARSVKRETAAKGRQPPGRKLASRPAALQGSLDAFVHWWKQGWRQIVFEIDQLARVKGMPLVDRRIEASPCVDVSIAHRNAIDALRELDRAGIANMQQEVPHELLWPVSGSFGGRIQNQDELDRTVSRLRQFPDEPGDWQKRIVDPLLEVRKLGESYFKSLAARLRGSKLRGSNRPAGKRPRSRRK